MMIIDTHAHLNMEDFVEDIDHVLERAQVKDVKKIIVIGMDRMSSIRAIELSKKYPMLYATGGIHPGYVDQETDLTFVIPMIDKGEIVAIGECGLDFYWTKDNMESQKEVFQKHIDLAATKRLPLVIHTRNSFKEAYDMLLPYKGRVTGVFHCFSSDLRDAERAVDLGFYIGIDGPVTYKNNHELVEIIQGIDLSHILVETDSPYLAPHPYRGKRNEPGYTHYVVETIATLKGLSVEVVKEQTTKNAYDLFHIGG